MREIKNPKGELKAHIESIREWHELVQPLLDLGYELFGFNYDSGYTLRSKLTAKEIRLSTADAERICDSLRILRDADEIATKVCKEWAEDDTFIKNLCQANDLTEQEIYGDFHYVPDIQQKLKTLVVKLGGKLSNT